MQNKYSPFAQVVRCLRRPVPGLLLTTLLTAAWISPDLPQGALQKRISFQAENATLRQVLQDLSTKAAVPIAFTSDLPLDEKTSVRASHEALDDVLLRLLRPLGLNYRVVAGQVIIEKQAPTSTLSSPTSNVAIEVKGVVRDAATGEPLPGATVLVKGTTTGTSTSDAGAFTLQVPDEDAVLVVNFIGYDAQEIRVGSQRTLNIALKTNATSLDQVVVVGYTTQEAKDVTGAVGILPLDRVKNFPVASVDKLLQGQVAGVQVSNDGAPGGNSVVRVRGLGTLGDNDPLYIIDGVPTKAGLNQLNPNDIESMQVLKDASSTAIYGARASNGVVVITTKQGKAGKTQLSFDSYYGVQSVYNLPHMVSPAQLAQVEFDAQRNSGQTPSHPQYGNGAQPVLPEFLQRNPDVRANQSGTNWFKTIFRPAPIQNYSLGLSGGSESSRHAINLTYFDQDGILKYTGFKRVSLRANTEYTILKRLKVGENFTASYGRSTQASSNAVNGGVVFDAFRMPSIVPVRDEAGNFAGPAAGLGDASNPLRVLYNARDNPTRTIRALGNAYAELELVDNLFVRSSIGVDYLSTNFRGFSPSFTEGIATNPTASLTNNNAYTINWTWTNIARYSRDFGQHNVAAVIGTEAIQNTDEGFTAYRENFLINNLDFRYLDAGQGLQTNGGTGSAWALFSLFGRLDYNYAGKYLFSASVRRDGSSRFPSDNRYAVFPAFSAGWRLSEESFFKEISWLSNLKLRASWGQSGNQEIGNYPAFDIYGISPTNTNYPITGSNGTVQTGYTARAIGNPRLKWETTTQTDIGIDFGVIRNRLNLSVDVFDKTTKDVLVRVPRPALAGEVLVPYENAGRIRNRGLEFLINYQSDAAKDFHWGVSANGSIVRNKVLSLGGGSLYIPGYVSNNLTRGLSLSRTEVGKPVAYFYGYVVDGIFQNQNEVDAAAAQKGKAVGRWRYKDLNGDGTVNEQDQQQIGKPEPDFTYGVNLNVAYKNFDLSGFIQGVQGISIYNFSKYHTDFAFDPFNKSTRILDSWTPQNTDAKLPQLSKTNVNDELRPSTYFVENGSYARLKNLQLGYTLPLAWTSAIKASSLRVYVQAQNLFTITKYSGMDPEVNLQNYNSADRNLDQNIDRGYYPQPRAVLFGVNARF
ncbi:SusC/RagA family TonB-linked outer membrane protein [Hymenobacter jejuensis]|uniref:TonB-dependent receptor n=1 Tax=Hymenobacter jejuensis TaxID=2502781 RepID=A0A5B7ZZW0_9BACT|nr:TonB-dependent receptor [Hymenobacter jejuensis]QDA60417.1 TonB-dependent receptor [Hymenobacter jejuensis]